MRDTAAWAITYAVLRNNLNGMLPAGLLNELCQELADKIVADLEKARVLVGASEEEE